MAGSSMVTKRVTIPTSNYTKGRGGYKVRGIVIHHAVTTNIKSVDTTFTNPNRHGSAHYCVDGKEVHQYVDENDTAWHCSNYWGNQNTIGIENVKIRRITSDCRNCRISTVCCSIGGLS